MYVFAPGDSGSNPGVALGLNGRSVLKMYKVNSYPVRKNEKLLEWIVTSGGITSRY